MPERVLSASVICGAPPLRLLGTQEMFWPYRVVLALRHWPSDVLMSATLGTIVGLVVVGAIAPAGDVARDER